MSVESAPDHPAPSSGKKPNKGKQLISSLSSCPPLTPFTTYASLVLVAFLIFGTLWGLTGDDCLPGGQVFGLYILGIVSYLGGQLMKLCKIPTLVGMMVFGFILRNVPVINVAKDINSTWAEVIRNMALILILLRAGLEVDGDVLKGNKATCCKLIFIPFIAELCSAAIAAHYLFNMPWEWSFLCGAMLSAVSPAVVLPVMLKMQKKGIGTENGVPTMVIAVAGIDDVLALTAFEVLLGVTFASGNMGWTIAQGPVEMIVGIIFGILLGIVCWFIPNPDEKSRSVFRFMLLVFGGMCVLFGSQRFKWGAAGALGCICLPFVAAIRWKQGADWDHEDNPVSDALAFLWRIIEPLLFGLIGSEMKIEDIEGSTVGLGLATLFIGIGLRMLGSFFAAFTSGLTLKEQIFVTFAGLPKATVQAAIGPVALDIVKKSHSDGPEIQYGMEILTVAVLAILITAPLGATAISLLAPRLLGDPDKDKPDKNHINEDKNKDNNIRDASISMYDIHMDFNSYSIKDDTNRKVVNTNEDINQTIAVAKL